MTIVLFDTPIGRQKSFPFSLIRPIATVRHGIFTGLEWYAMAGKLPVVILSEDYLTNPLPNDDNFLCIDATIVPSINLFGEILNLEVGEMLEDENGILAFRSNTTPVYGSLPIFLKAKKTNGKAERIGHPMDWVKTNAAKIVADIELIKNKLIQLSNADSNKVFGPYPVWVSPSAKIQGCTFNTEEGPVYVGDNAHLMEGSIFRGPVAIGKKSVVKMGTQMYGGTTIGEKCTAGGEIKNSILGDFSNKAHHGYLGDSIIGQWCNLGAGTSNSNVKNNAGFIKMYSGLSKSLIPIGQKAGMVMGDFSKTAIHTAINTGTTVGVGCSLHHPFPIGKVVPSFSWGTAEKYQLEKLKRDIESWMAFKQEKPDARLNRVLEHLYANPYIPYDESHG